MNIWLTKEQLDELARLDESALPEPPFSEPAVCIGPASIERQRVVTLSPDCVRFNVAARRHLARLIDEVEYWRARR